MNLKRNILLLVSLGLTFGLLLAGGTRVHAQLSSGGQVPSPLYFSGMALLHEGEYRDALSVFESNYRSAMKFGTRRFLDSVCYLAMMGECYYHMGQLERAYENYTAALELAVSYPTWMQQVILPPTGPSPLSTGVRPPPWGQRTRTSALAQVPVNGLYRYAQILVDPQLQEQGAIVPQEARTVNVAEIIRCIALALRRRQELLGPLSVADPANRPASSVFSAGYTPPNHWSQCWGDLLAGLCAIGDGRVSAAVPLLTRASTAVGQFEHQLSPVALIELGKLALARADFNAARTFFLEASYDAYYYGDALLLEESMNLVSLAHLVGRSQDVDPVLPQALAWAKTKRLFQLQVSLDLSIAEQALASGNVAVATTALDDAQATIGRRQMAGGRLGAKLGFLRAVALLKGGAIPQGESALNTVLPAVQQCSLWLFQLNRLARLYGTGEVSLRGPVTPRTVHQLYELVLRHPTDLDWALSPIECFAVTTAPHVPAFEQWFTIAWERKQWEDALEIADRTRQHRFESALPLGGRLDELRRLLDGPEAQLDNQARLVRKNLLTRYPRFAELSQQSQKLRQQLAAATLLPQTSEEQVGLQKTWEAWADLSRQQEAILRAVAVDREAVGIPFPPLAKLKEIQTRLPEGSVLWVFFSRGNNLYSFFIAQDRYDAWQVRGGTIAVQRQLTQLLLALGFQDGNKELSIKELTATEWQQNAANLLTTLTAGSNADLTADFRELIIVPDGVVWYVPFEALQIKVDNNYLPLIAKHQIRYAVTASLAVATVPSALPPQPRTLLVLGRLNPQEEPATLEKRGQTILQAVPGAITLRADSVTAPPALMAKLFHQLIVWDDLGDTYVPLTWSPLRFGRSGASVHDWLAFPSGSPELLVLPGFHMASEAAFRKANFTPTGQEIFLSVAGLQAAGARTILLGRWRTGGGTLATILKEYLREYPQGSAAAFQRAVLLASSEPLDPADEPRVQKKELAQPLQKTHPFFWANLCLIDPGEATAEVEPKEPQQPAAQEVDQKEDEKD